MPRRKKKPHDFSIIAHRVVQEATEEAEETEPRDTGSQEADGKNPHAVALGRLGGKKGGRARAEKLSPDKRKEIARIAAEARWKKAQG